LSHALQKAQTLPARLAGAAGPAPARFQIVLLAVGICVLAVWIIRRLTHRSKLSLRHAPGQPNDITPFHILILIAVWAGSLAAFHHVLKALSVAQAGGTMLLTTVVQHAVLLAGSLAIAAMTFRAGLLRGLGFSLRHWPWDAARGVAGYLTAVPLATGLLWLTRYVLPEKPHELLDMIKASPPLRQAVAIFAGVVLAPIAEEVFFRGLLQSMVRKYTQSAWAGILAASLLFALAHYSNPQTIPALFALGVVLGYNYARCGRLLAPILTHAIFNAVSIIAFMSTGK